MTLQPCYHPPAVPDKPVPVSDEIARTLCRFFRAHGGVYMWQDKELTNDPANDVFVARLSADGSDNIAMAPHWRFGNRPELVITDPNFIEVQIRKELQRLKYKETGYTTGPVAARNLIRKLRKAHNIPEEKEISYGWEGSDLELVYHMIEKTMLLPEWAKANNISLAKES